MPSKISENLLPIEQKINAGYGAKTIAKMHLLADEDGSKRLLDTMEAFNAACNEIAETCFNEQTASKYTIQSLVYHAIREKYGLSAQLTIRAISKVCEAFKVNKKVKPTFKKHGSITYDSRILTFKGLHLQHPQVSITTLEGRQLFNLNICAYFRGRADTRSYRGRCRTGLR